MKNQKAFFFSTDALIALIIIILSILIIYPALKTSQSPNFIKEDLIEVLSELKVGEFNDSFINQLIIDGNITDLNKSILEQIGEFYVVDSTRPLAIKLANLTLSKINTTQNIGIWFDDDMIICRNITPYESAEYVEVETQTVTGVREGENITGFSSRAYLSNDKQTKYYYFGGYVGEGNISIIIDYNGEINSIEMEAAISNDFLVYVNGNLTTSYSKSLNEYTPSNYILNTSFFQQGNNTLEIQGNNIHITGGFIKIIYKTDMLYEQPIRNYFPGINGPINIYDGFYIPSTLSDMKIFLHYYTNSSMFLAIANTTIFNSTNSNESSVLLNNSYLQTKLDYPSLTGKNVPVRLGLENMSVGSGGGAVDIAFLIDSTGSMGEEINSVYLIANDFTRSLSDSSIDYRLALIEFKDYATSPCGSSGDFPYRIYKFVEEFVLDTSQEWLSGNITNLTSENGYLTLSKNDIDSKKVIDQNQLKSGSSTNVYRNNIVAQTFIPSWTGNLTEIKINASRTGTPPNIVVEIREVINGMIQPAVLISSENASVGISPSIINFQFANPILLTEGNSYAMIIKAKNNAGSSSNRYSVYNNNNIQYNYLNGNYRTSTNNGSSWTTSDSADMFFMTIMSGKQYNKNGVAVYQYNAESIVDWSSFIIAGNYPLMTNVSIFFRSSNDTITWTNWNQNIANVPNGKYLEQRINLTSNGNATPIIDATAVAYNPNDLKNFTTKSYTFRRAVNSLVASGGNDLPESHLRAINESIFNLSWRDNVKKFDILLTDAQPHATDCLINSGGTPVNTDESCNSGPKSVMTVANSLVQKNITFFLINTNYGLCDYNHIMDVNMTTMTKGRYYSYSNSASIRDILISIAGQIINITYANQTALVTGGIYSRLYPDSYIEFNYSKSDLPYGLMITLEKEFYNNLTGNFSIPKNSTIVEAKVVSYSGSRWTDYLGINNNTIYNLSSFGSVYIKLGDPYVLNIPTNYISENNSVTVTTGLSPANSTEGSSHNKIIYKIIKNLVSFSSLSPSSEGCNWSIEFEDDTLLSSNIPQSYIGPNLCYYRSDRYKINQNAFNIFDSAQYAVHNLFKLLDFDSNGKLDIKFTEQNLNINSSEISGIPYHVSTKVQIRKWY